jgi:hypothetical protein
VGYINPLFGEQKIIKESSSSKKSSKPRKIRSDKTHTIKFPVNEIERMKLRSLCKQVKLMLEEQGKPTIEQTKFNTLLLQYALDNQHLISFDLPYKDSKNYMHTSILRTQYEREIGGPHGLNVRKGMSDRKIAYMGVISILNWLERDGDIEKIIQ